MEFDVGHVDQYRKNAIIVQLRCSTRCNGSLVSCDTPQLKGSDLVGNGGVDLMDRYIAYLRAVGRNPATGPTMGSTLIGAGFELVGRDAQYVMPPRGRGVRPPSWAARDAMVDAGIASTDDVERWDRALTDDLDNVVNTFIAAHLIIGRTPQP